MLKQVLVSMHQTTDGQRFPLEEFAAAHAHQALLDSHADIQSFVEHVRENGPYKGKTLSMLSGALGLYEQHKASNRCRRMGMDEEETE